MNDVRSFHEKAAPPDMSLRGTVSVMIIDGIGKLSERDSLLLLHILESERTVALETTQRIQVQLTASRSKVTSRKGDSACTRKILNP